jgi:hypothetical protein
MVTIPKLRENLMKNYQAIHALLTFAGISPDVIQSGPLKNYGIDGEAILSQNTVATSDEEDEEDSSMDVDEDDETIGNLDISDVEAAKVQEFHSRSTIL